MKIQLDATVCSLIYFTAKSLYMFRVSPHPSSGVLKTVPAASGTGHHIGTTTFLQRGHNLATLEGVAVPEAIVTVLCTPVDGCGDTRNM